MSAEDMTLDAALSIARSMSGWSETAKEKALRVLAEAYRTERAKSLPRCTCDYAGIEGENHKPWCEIEGGPHAECRDRIADLEAQLAQQGQIMREQGAEIRDAEREATNAWYAAQDGGWS